MIYLMIYLFIALFLFIKLAIRTETFNLKSVYDNIAKKLYEQCGVPIVEISSLRFTINIAIDCLIWPLTLGIYIYLFLIKKVL